MNAIARPSPPVSRHTRAVSLAAAALAAGCGSGPRAGAPAGGAGSGSAIATAAPRAARALCDASFRAYLALGECVATGEDAALLAQVRAAGPDELTSREPADPAGARAQATLCGGLLDEWVQLAEVAGCRVELSAGERAGLDVERARRTPVPAGASGDQRRFLEGLARLRDRTCACATRACVEALDPELDALFAGVRPADRDADRAAGGAMHDEMDGCRRRATFAQLATELPAGPARRLQVAAFLRPSWARDARRAPPRVATDRAPPGGITSLALPDGQLLRWSDVAAITDEYDHERAVGLFEDVARCRARQPPDPACERAALAAYVEE